MIRISAQFIPSNSALAAKIGPKASECEGGHDPPGPSECEGLMTLSETFPSQRIPWAVPFLYFIASHLWHFWQQ